MEEGEKMNMTTPGKKKKYKAKDKCIILAKEDIKKSPKCFFCKKKGHVEKEYTKFKNWLDKKDTQLSLVCYESNMIDVNHDTWWIDFGSSIYVINSLQRLQDLRKLVGSEHHIYSGNKIPSHVEAIGTCKLVLN